MKTCRVCIERKSPDDFHRDKYKSDGLATICKPCASKKLKAYYRANSDLIRARSAKWHAENFVRKTENMNRWVSKNRKRSGEIKKLWANNNPEKVSALSARRQGAELRATPAWSNLFFINEAYELARMRTKMLGYPWHVDHIVPIQSKKVCGLHVENNLRVIPAAENILKSNKRWPGMLGMEA